MVSRVLAHFPMGCISVIILLCYTSAVIIVPLNSEITVEMVSMSFVWCGGVCVYVCMYVRARTRACTGVLFSSGCK